VFCVSLSHISHTRAGLCYNVSMYCMLTGGYGPQTRSGPTMERNMRLEKLLFKEAKTGINFDQYDKIPVETSGTGVPKPVKLFSELALHEVVHSNIGLCHYTKPTPVQKWAIPIALAGRDLMACAQTGTCAVLSLSLDDTKPLRFVVLNVYVYRVCVLFVM